MHHAESGGYTQQDMRYSPYPQYQQLDSGMSSQLFRTPAVRAPRWPVPSLTSGLPAFLPSSTPSQWPLAALNRSASYQFYDQQHLNEPGVKIAFIYRILFNIFI